MIACHVHHSYTVWEHIKYASITIGGLAVITGLIAWPIIRWVNR